MRTPSLWIAITCALVMGADTALADSQPWQWLGPDPAGAAKTCTKRVDTGPPTYRYRVKTREVAADTREVEVQSQYDSGEGREVIDKACMRKSGHRLDPSISEPASNPDWVRMYRERFGIELKTAAQRAEDERRIAEEAEAKEAAARNAKDNSAEREEAAKREREATIAALKRECDAMTEAQRNSSAGKRLCDFDP